MVALPTIVWLPQPPAWRVDWPALLAACPWLAPLAETPQDPIHHAEGDVLTHTRMVAEALAAMPAWRDLAPDARARLFLAALLHDIGKPATTQIESGGRIGAPGHARVGAAMARGLLWGEAGLGSPLGLRDREAIVALVRLHGLPIWFLDRPDMEWSMLSASVVAPLDHVALLAEADARGRLCADQPELLTRIDLFRSWCAEHHCLEGPFPFSSDHARVRYCRRIQADPRYHPHNESWGEVTLLSGLPGAGKDTWARAQLPQLPVVALDAIRTDLGIDAAAPQGAVIQEAKDRARALLRRRQPFLWNATNLTRRMRDPLVDLLLAYGARARLVYIDAPPAVALARNQARPSPVPPEVIRRLAEKAEPPDLREAHAVEWIESI